MSIMFIEMQISMNRETSIPSNHDGMLNVSILRDVCRPTLSHKFY